MDGQIELSLVFIELPEPADVDALVGVAALEGSDAGASRLEGDVAGDVAEGVGEVLVVDGGVMEGEEAVEVEGGVGFGTVAIEGDFEVEQASGSQISQVFLVGFWQEGQQDGHGGGNGLAW